MSSPTKTRKRSQKDSTQPNFMDRYLAWFIRWMPESFVICLALTVFVGALAYFATDTPFISTDPETANLVGAWYEGFWSLLAFTMQMTVLLATGSAVASSPPAQKVLTRIARIPNNRVQAILLGAISAALLGYIHWGLGMMGAIVLGKELLAQSRRKGYDLHPPVLIAALFMAFLPSSAGISGAAVLYAATPGYLRDMVPDDYKDRVPESVPLTDTVISPGFILLLVICSVITIGFALMMHPKNKSKIDTISDEFLDEIEAGGKQIAVARTTPAEKANASRWIMYFIGGIGLLYSVYILWTGGVTGLNLNSFNFLFLSLGMVLTANWGPEYYAKLIRDGIAGTWGFILQFPFYAGIFGLISFTGLGVVISNFFTAISTATTWPVIAFLYSALLNIAVPSGGSKFVIEAPYIVPTTVDLGADMGLILQAYQMGDGTTNLLIPFFALPYLANFKIKFSQVVGYTVPPVLLTILVTCIYLYVRASMG